MFALLQCISRYDGDLVAKCYYAKRKLVWEVLDSSLKSKMEVQWSDISGLRASFLEDQSAVLDIEVVYEYICPGVLLSYFIFIRFLFLQLSRPPLFFREINPQPRKHTLWQSTSDFTDGQATICRFIPLLVYLKYLLKHPLQSLYLRSFALF